MNPDPSASVKDATEGIWGWMAVAPTRNGYTAATQKSLAIAMEFTIAHYSLGWVTVSEKDGEGSGDDTSVEMSVEVRHVATDAEVKT